MLTLLLITFESPQTPSLSISGGSFLIRSYCSPETKFDDANEIFFRQPDLKFSTRIAKGAIA